MYSVIFNILRQIAAGYSIYKAFCLPFPAKKPEAFQINF